MHGTRKINSLATSTSLVELFCPSGWQIRHYTSDLNSALKQALTFVSSFLGRTNSRRIHSEVLLASRGFNLKKFMLPARVHMMLAMRGHTNLPSHRICSVSKYPFTQNARSQAPLHTCDRWRLDSDSQAWRLAEAFPKEAFRAAD